MKTTLTIEITTADVLPVLMEDGDIWEEYTPEQKKECAAFQKEFAQDFHKALVRAVQDDAVVDAAFERATEDEFSVEGWESLKDYKSSIKVKKLGK